MHLLIADGGNRADITYGSFKIFTDTGELIKHKQIVFGYGTSNLAEYLAVIAALHAALELEIKNVVIMTDSNLVKEQIYGNNACNYAHLKIARDRARKLLKEFDSWEIVKVKRNIIVAQLGH